MPGSASSSLSAPCGPEDLRILFGGLSFWHRVWKHKLTHDAVFSCAALFPGTAASEKHEAASTSYGPIKCHVCMHCLPVAIRSAP